MDAFKKAVNLNPEYSLAGENYLKCFRALEGINDFVKPFDEQKKQAAGSIQKYWRNYVERSNSKSMEK